MSVPERAEAAQPAEENEVHQDIKSSLSKSTSSKRLFGESISVSVLISIAALLFSFGTTLVSYIRTKQQDVHDARVELRQLIQILNKIPLDNLENTKKFENDALILAQLSGLLNNENSVVAKQAYDVINRISDNVAATEYLTVANALVGSYLFDKAINLYQGGLRVANDANDESNLLRSYGYALYFTGDVEGGRSQYRAALNVFSKYKNSNNFFIESTNFTTELSWADVEFANHQCGYAKAHLAQADSHLSAMGAGPSTLQFKGQLMQEQSKIGSCS